MLHRPFFALIALTLALLLIGCSGDEETLPDATATSTNSAITICPRIGIAGEATPPSPTPEPSCAPGDDFSAPPGVRGTIKEAPPLPSGTTALTQYIEFTFRGDPPRGSIGLPPAVDLSSIDAGRVIGTRSVDWYTFESGTWHRLASGVGAGESADGEIDIYTGNFDPIPSNLILLVE